MLRRDLIRFLGGAAVVPALTGLTPERLLALARHAHGRNGVPRGAASPAGAATAYRALEAEQAETVATLAELIIPETDTPGARDAGVTEFIDLIVAEWYNPVERERFFEGLAGVDARSRTTFGAAFTSLSREEQVAVLHGLDAEVTALHEAAAAREEAVPAAEEAAAAPEEVAEEEAPLEEAPLAEAAAAGRDVAALREAAAPDPDEADPDDHFFAQMKWLTMYGYYTSEVGVNQELEYVVIPGGFDPCVATGLRPDPEGR